jgi:tRNA(Ile)-lysidine synthetase-like protein
MPDLLRTVSGENADIPAGLEGADVIARAPLLEYHPAVQARLLREWLRRHGILLDEAGTRGLLEFTRTGSSGRSFQLPGLTRLVREFDVLVLRSSEAGVDGGHVTIPGTDPGTGRMVIGNRTYEVVWGEVVGADAGATESFSVADLRFPLRLRARAPGDRIRLAYGSKKLKKLYAEGRIAKGERRSIPVLVDGVGRVLWVPGLARSVLAVPESDQNSLELGLIHVRND